MVVDEAHELSSRVTQAATDELSIPAIERAARRARNFVDGSEADEVEDAADALRAAMEEVTPEELTSCLRSLPPRCSAPICQRSGILRVPEGLSRFGG